MSFVEWCNNNSGFMSAVLSLIGLVVSGVAIYTSVRAARLPYKKKLKLSTDEVAIRTRHNTNSYKTSRYGILICCVNVGSREILVTCLGVCAKHSRRSLKYQGFDGTRYSLEGEHTNIIMPTQVKTTFIFKERLRKYFSSIDKKDKIYLYARDSEGKEYYKKIMNYSEFYELYLKD